MYSSYKLNKQGDNIQPSHTPFPIWNQSWFYVDCNYCFLTCIQISQEAVKWSDITIFLRTVHSSLWSTQSKALALVNEAEVDVLPEFSCFFYDPLDFGNLSLVPVYFLNPAWISGGSGFTYFWSLAWRILSVTLIVCEWVKLCGSLNILWRYSSLGLKWKVTFSSPVSIAEFTKFAGILSVAISQHHLSGFEIAQLEFHHLH